MAKLLPDLTKLKLAVIAFRKSLMQTDLLKAGDDADSWAARRLRYEINWRFYENEAYSDVNTWAQAYRTQYGLPKDIEGVYNPIYRLVEFWVAHIWGGKYDPELGDGKLIDSSLPFVFKEGDTSSKVQEALATVYRWSNWQIHKDIITLYGTIFGDVFLRVVDDADDEKVYYEVVHPGTIQSVELDRRGNITGYVIIEERVDPKDPLESKIVEYREVAEKLKEGGTKYTTYREQEEYEWYAEHGTSWIVDEYDFVPMVYIQHKNVGKDWGWSEFHALRNKIHNLDSLATAISTFIQQSVKAPWLFGGVKKPKVTTKITGNDPTTVKPIPTKDEMRALWGPSGATAQHLVSPLELIGSLKFVETFLEDVERDYPELSMDIWNASGEQSARALRVARQKTEKKAIQRRASYDDALIRANKMALTIGAVRDYEEFQGLDDNGFKSKAFDHYLADRPIFVIDELEDLEIDLAFWKAAATAKEAGMSILVWLEEKGWSKERIKKLENSEEYQNRISLQNIALNQPLVNPTGDRGGRPTKPATEKP